MCVTAWCETETAEAVLTHVLLVFVDTVLCRTAHLLRVCGECERSREVERGRERSREMYS